MNGQPWRLTAAEQEHVREALRFLRRRVGSWQPLTKMLGMGQPRLSMMAVCNGPVSSNAAFRVARAVGVPVEDVLAGRYPLPGTCPLCGHREAAQ